MITGEIKVSLNELFKDFFANPAIDIREETTASDIDGWDSLNHISLIVAIEKKFKIKFTTKEIGSMKNVGELMGLILKKTGHAV